MLERNSKGHQNHTKSLDTHTHAFGWLPSLSFLCVFALRATSGCNFDELDHVYVLFCNVLFKFNFMSCTDFFVNKHESPFKFLKTFVEFSSVDYRRYLTSLLLMGF